MSLANRFHVILIMVYCSNMLDIKEPCHPKSMKHISAVLEQKRMYDEVKRSFIDKDTTIIEPVKKKSRSTKK